MIPLCQQRAVARSGDEPQEELHHCEVYSCTKDREIQGGRRLARWCPGPDGSRGSHRARDRARRRRPRRRGRGRGRLDWSNYEKILLTKDVGEPIDLAILPDGKILHTARNGDVRLTDPATGVTTVTNKVPVYANSEDGLQGIAVDPNFEDNSWVYLVYAPLSGTPAGSAPNTLPAGADESYWDQWKGVNRLSRFKWTGTGLDLASEQKIIDVETQRGQCCHVGADIDWDGDGNLYLSTGDNTPASTPGSNGFAPNNDAPGMNPDSTRVAAPATPTTCAARSCASRSRPTAATRFPRATSSRWVPRRPAPRSS
ncbi:PQQ-dependent sugar dehydrogenase [Oerskovia sp. M15]